MPLSILQTLQPISILKNCHTSYLRGVEQGVDKSDPAPPLDLVSASEEICPTPEQLRVRRQSRVTGEPVNDVPSHSFITHEAIAETQDQVGFHEDRPVATAEAAGKRILNVLPFPTSLSTEMVPRCEVMIP
jgi:hypothetical protein